MPRSFSHPPLGQAFTVNRASVQAAGLRSWWPPLATPGGGLRDMAGTWPGMLNDTAIAWTPEPENGTVTGSYSGSTKYINCGAIPHLSGATTFAITAWIRRAATGSKFAVGQGEDTADFPARSIQINPYSDGRIYLTLFLGTGFHAGSFASNDTSWHHVAMVYNSTLSGNAQIAGYLDGSAVSLSYAGSAVSSIPTMAGVFKIGRLDETATGGNFIGDVRVYDRPLSPAVVWQMWAPDSRWNLYAPVMRQRSKAAVALTAVFRRTLSDFGTRIGSRQVMR